MNTEKEESKKEKLARLLAENKTKLARDKLVDRYHQEINYQIAVNQFVDLKTSQEIKKSVYQKISALSGLKINEFQQIYDVIDGLRSKACLSREKLVILYYMDTKYTGGVYIKFENCWDIICRIKKPLSEIIVTEENLASGLCIEIEEYNYLLTTWGF